jgi:hypothetical protein
MAAETDIPDRYISARHLGISVAPYWAPGTLDGQAPVVDDDEETIWSGRARVKGGTEKRGWTLERAAVYVTDRRLIFLTPNFEREGARKGHFSGYGVAGVAVALAANVALDQAKKLAAVKPNTVVAMGHIRYEWLAKVTYRHVKSLLGVGDQYVDVYPHTSDGTFRVQLWGKPAVDFQLAETIVRAAASHRMNLVAGVADTDRQVLATYASGVGSSAAKRVDWDFPGDHQRLRTAAGY